MLECATEEATGSTSGPVNLYEDAGEDAKDKRYNAQDQNKIKSGLEQDQTMIRTRLVTRGQGTK